MKEAGVLLAIPQMLEDSANSDLLRNDIIRKLNLKTPLSSAEERLLKTSVKLTIANVRLRFFDFVKDN